MRHRRTIVVLVYPGIEALDLAGPASVFAAADRGLAEDAGGYDLRVVAVRAGEIPTESGYSVHAYGARALPTRIDTLVVPGGLGTKETVHDRAYLRLLARAAARSRRVTSVCSGAFLLAAAGLLDGRRATTHWKYAARLAESFPAVTVEPDAIFINDGNIWTSAGVTAGIDLALALVDADHGRALALSVARMLVCYVRRPGGQSQYGAPLAMQSSDESRVERVRALVLDQPGRTRRVAALAARAHVSERHLRRLAQRELSLTPRALLQQARFEQAQRLLLDGDRPIADVARRCGYGSTAAFSRGFMRRYGVAPREFRARFRATPGAAPPRR